MRPVITIAVALTLLSAAAPVRAQDDDIPLGDVARAARKQKPVQDEKPVIDNDNLPIMMDKAEAERLDGKPVFSIDPSGKSFRMTSPDGTCSLAFDARAAALVTTPYISSDLPAYELGKLEGRATIHDGFLEVTLHNASAWELKEIVVGVTLISPSGVELEPARLVSTVDAQLEARPPDATALYHLKSTAAAGATVAFRGLVNDELSQANDWHWALVAARGIPPVVPAVGSSTGPFTTSVIQQGSASSQPNPLTGAALQPKSSEPSSAPSGSSQNGLASSPQPQR
jgi:hypothetical protein